MKTMTPEPAAIAQPSPHELKLAGHWTALGVGALEQQLAGIRVAPKTEILIDGTGVKALDTVGAWILQNHLDRLRDEGHAVQMQGWNPRFVQLLALIADSPAVPPASSPRPNTMEHIGRLAAGASGQALAFLGFIGESAVALAGNVAHPSRLRWRPILHNIRSAGFDALPIVGLLSFLLGIVIAYQAADQLRQYGANIFVADLVGLSMLREFAPLMTAIIVAGRSGSAYAAQIGTIGIAPIDLLVLPKLIALIVVMPLLTFFADVLGVFGGMIMARVQLGVGFDDFLDRFAKAVSITSYLIGIGKAPVFAAIIAVVGCFQGFQTSGGADSVGRQTTRSVVQAIFLVVVADALFSVLFSLLDL